MTQGLEVLPKQSEIIQKVFKFTNLDFRDKYTGIPIQYDVYVQKIKVKTIQPYNLFLSTEEFDDEIEHYVISDIQVNNILGNDPTKNGVTLYFKINGTTQWIYIKYDLFESILEVLGSYYSIFDVIGGILSFFYSDYFFQADILNSVFSFTENHLSGKGGRKFHRRNKNYEDDSSDGDESESGDNSKDINNNSNKNDRKYGDKDKNDNDLLKIIPFNKNNNNEIKYNIEMNIKTTTQNGKNMNSFIYFLLILI